MSVESKVDYLSEEQIDEIVIAQANNYVAWEEPVLVRRDTPIEMSLPPDLVTRATFLARLHKASSVEEWLGNIIKERIDFEEAAFAGLKQSLVEG